MDKPRTFEHFPNNVICPICRTNDDAETILIPIDGTNKDGISEAKPVHLWCSVANRYNPEVNVIYRMVPHE